MADIKHTHAAVAAPTGPTEGDGVSYRGIVWFVVILTVTTLVCQVLMWWFHRWEYSRLENVGGPLAPYAASGPPPAPNLVPLNTLEMPEAEVTYLQRFRESEDKILKGYGWVDQNAGVVRIPIDRAKTLMLERGFPVKTGK
jgi:hypothetical protein